MADIALRTSGDISLDVVSEENLQDTQPAGLAMEAGTLVGYDANGAWTSVGVTAATAASIRTGYGIIVRKVAVGEYVTAIRRGVVDGFNLDARAYGDPIYFSNNAGAIADAAGTATGYVGRVIPARGNLRGGAADKVLLVDLSN